MPFLIHYEDTRTRLERSYKITSWLESIIADHGYTIGDINLILTSDQELLTINKNFLNRDNYTDVISFSYSHNQIISGDIFISTQRIDENANYYHVTFLNELYRVCAHGILHLIGYNDYTNEDKTNMRKLENLYLSRLKDE